MIEIDDDDVAFLMSLFDAVDQLDGYPMATLDGFLDDGGYGRAERDARIEGLRQKMLAG